MEKSFKVLSIDGGGIKGLYSATVLKHLEERFGAPLYKHFDLICGTSTGGLIALALSLGKSSEAIANFYADRGAQIFPDNTWLKRRFGGLRQVLWGGKYSDKQLKTALNEFLGDQTIMADAKTHLCIPAFNLTTGEPIVFKKPFGNYYRDGNLNMVDVALATSAAPTYFPLAKIDHPNLQGLFADGGLWANNPTLCGVLEALDHFVGPDKPYSTYKVLSIASIAQPNGWRFKGSRKRSFVKWKDRLFQTTLDGQSYFTDFFAQKIISSTTPQGSYFRIPSPKQLSKEHSKDIDMDLASTASLDTLMMLGNTQGTLYTTRPEHREELSTFFNTSVLSTLKPN
jgi:predicted acylesterase/phospholipase RssA